MMNVQLVITFFSKIIMLIIFKILLIHNKYAYNSTTSLWTRLFYLKNMNKNVIPLIGVI